MLAYMSTCDADWVTGNPAIDQTTWSLCEEYPGFMPPDVVQGIAMAVQARQSAGVRGKKPDEARPRKECSICPRIGRNGRGHTAEECFANFMVPLTGALMKKHKSLPPAARAAADAGRIAYEAIYPKENAPRTKGAQPPRPRTAAALTRPGRTASQSLHARFHERARAKAPDAMRRVSRGSSTSSRMSRIRAPSSGCVGF